MKYLHKHGDHQWSLDHRLTPEVRAMLVAMTSRMPLGGLAQRYSEIVATVARGLLAESPSPLSFNRACQVMYRDIPMWITSCVQDDRGYRLSLVTTDLSRSVTNVRAEEIRVHDDVAEDRLCQYPLHPKAQEFFDKFVGEYGHSSILENTGEPAVYVDGISWYAAYLLFDSPLVCGQENSTRAVTRRDWPACREATELVGAAVDAPADEHVPPPEKHRRPHAGLREIHDEWMSVFETEKAAWEKRLADPAERVRLGIADKEPFRPALDRARWALPGTISTGAAFTSHVRERSRALRDARAVCRGELGAAEVFDEVTRAYREAAPGLAAHGLREAVYEEQQRLPKHLDVNYVSDDGDVTLILTERSRRWKYWSDSELPSRKAGTYADPCFNHMINVDLRILCSIACARDWHRHRTFYPWTMHVVVSPEPAKGQLVIDRHYEVIGDGAEKRVEELLRASWVLHRSLRADGRNYLSMLALPMGTRVRMCGNAGLRDALYALELRACTPGANFEYKDQAERGLVLLSSELASEYPWISRRLALDRWLRGGPTGGEPELAPRG